MFYEYYRQKMDARHVEPNITHNVLADWEKEGKLLAVVTQNIDGLHQKAGSQKVYELHGTTLRNYCAWCKKEYQSDYLFDLVVINKEELDVRIDPENGLFICGTLGDVFGKLGECKK